jgi:hypothetical protein
MSDTQNSWLAGCLWGLGSGWGSVAVSYAITGHRFDTSHAVFYGFSALLLAGISVLVRKYRTARP